MRQGETPCIGCGYDLRGLAVDGVCPECGLPIARSIGDDRLESAEPRWLRAIVRGQRILAGGLALIILLGVGGLFVGLGGAILGSAFPEIGRYEWVFHLAMAVLFVGAMCGMALSAGGAFVVTTREPRDTDRETPMSVRRRARWGMVLVIGLILVGEVLDISTNRTVRLVGDVVTFLGLIAFAVAIVSILSLLANVCERIPNATLANSMASLAKSFRWQIPFIAITGFALQLRGVYRGGPFGGFIDIVCGLAGCTSFVVIIIFIVCVVAFVINMISMERELRDVLRKVSRQ